MEKNITRRLFTKSAVAALAMPAIITRPGWAQTGPIKIGSVQPMTGSAQLFGKQNVMGLELVIERFNKAGGVFGRELAPVVADYEGKTDLGSRRARELLLDEKVDAIECFGGAIAIVCSQLAAQTGKIFVTPQAVPTELTEQSFERTSFFASLSSLSFGRMMAYVASQHPFTRIAQFHSDTANGHAIADSFRKRFAEIKRPDQEIVSEEFFPAFTISDFSPYVTKLDSGGEGLIISTAFGPDLRNLLVAGRDLQWKQKLVNWALEDANIAKAVGDGMLGHIQVQQTMATGQNAATKALVADWTAKYKDVPDLHLKYPLMAAGKIVTCWDWFFNVLVKAGSLDKEAVIAAAEGFEIDSPSGKMFMRACDHQMGGPAAYGEFLRPAEIPEDIRFFGEEFPFAGPAKEIPAEHTLMPQSEVNNTRCKA